MFVTVFYGVVDKRARHLVFARAGHDRPFMLRKGSCVDLGGNGTALGVIESASWRSKSMRWSSSAATGWCCLPMA